MAFISQIKLSDTTYDISAIKLKNARTIFGKSFDGTGNVAGKPFVYGSYTSTAANRYANSGIEVRENGLVGNTQSDIGYAPSIGFHWSGRIAASLLFHNDGNFYLRKQDGTSRASLDANLIGNAATATKLATARAISLTGDVTGSGSFDGSGNLSITATVADNSHNHTFLTSPGRHTEVASSTTASNPSAGLLYSKGLYMTENYNDANTPVNYGNIINVAGTGTSQIFCEWSGSDNTTGGMFYRSHRDTATGGWGGWRRIWLQGDAVTGAVWNDYAEYRESDCKEFGYVLSENGDDTLLKTTERLQHFAGVSSDTWGFSQGETDKAKTPIAVAGRVLVYPYQDRNNYKPGDCVCAAPGGTVDIMTREEVREWPDRIVGTVSCVPDYEEWGGGEGADRDPVKVNGRIWIKVK